MHATADAPELDTPPYAVPTASSGRNAIHPEGVARKRQVRIDAWSATAVWRRPSFLWSKTWNQPKSCATPYGTVRRTTPPGRHTRSISLVACTQLSPRSEEHTSELQ